MRITDRLITKKVLRNIEARRTNVARLQENLSTGKTFRVPSDDPALSLRVIRSVEVLAQVKRYRANASWAYNMVMVVDSALNEAYQALVRMKELAIAASSDTCSTEARRAIGEEVAQLVEHLAQVGNSKYGDKYVLAGHQTLKPPFVLQWNPGASGGLIPALTYDGDNSVISAEVGDGVVIDASIPGSEALPEDKLGALTRLAEALYSDDPETIRDSLPELDYLMDALLEARTKVGAMMARAEVAEKRLEAVHFETTKMVSQDYDVDFAECLATLKVEENAYQMALIAGARLVQPSLIYFLS